MKIRAVYQSQYNGLSIYIDGQDADDDPRVQAAGEIITERADEHCDGDGYLEGSIHDVEAIVREELAKEFGDGHEVTFEEDDGQS